MPSVAQASGRTAVQKGCLRSLSVGRGREIRFLGSGACRWEKTPAREFREFARSIAENERRYTLSTPLSVARSGLAHETFLRRPPTSRELRSSQIPVFVASHRLSLAFASNRPCARKQRGPSITTSRPDALTPARHF